MGCKCEKLVKLYKEMDNLYEMEDMLRKLADSHRQTGESLDDIAHAIPITLNAPEEKKLCTDVIQLNKDTATGLAGMEKHINKAQDKLAKLIIKTEKEDDAYHRTHKGKGVITRTLVGRMDSIGSIYIDMRDHVI